MERYLQDPGDGWRLGISVPRTSYLASVNVSAYNIDPDPGPAKYYTTAASIANTADPLVSTASTLPPTTGAALSQSRALCDAQVANMSFADDEYELPCEFLPLGCLVTFVPTRLEDWISHSESHFRPAPLPRRSMCTYCDQPTVIFEARSDRSKAWRSRMLHIAGMLSLQAVDACVVLTIPADLRRGYPVDHTKPDLYVLEHLYKHKIISKEEFAHMTKYSERTTAEPREDVRSEERSSRTEHRGKHREHSRHDEKHRKHSRHDGRKEYPASLHHK